MDLILAMFNGVFRAALAWAGGYLMAKGLVSSDVWTSVTNNLLGVGASLIPVAWTVYAKWRDRNKTDPTKGPQ